MKHEIVPGGILDIPTAKELGEEVGHHFDAYLRDTFRGMKLMRIPITRVTATGAAFTLGGNPGGNVPGPDQGYIWRISRIMVASNSLTDAAKWSLYVGSDTAATDLIHLVDIGGTVNTPFRPGNKTEWVFAGEQIYAAITGATTGNTYAMTGIVAEVPAEMIGKIL